MCGIAGILNLDGSHVLHSELKAMTNAISHRGPDGEGVWIEGPIGLGHRRLAIIDLSSMGNQPMVSADGRFVLSFNGEVYNYLELKITLMEIGYRFRSNTDTEVVLASFSEWGVDAIPKFNGMFAFSIWDKKSRKLTIARDRYGIKPLYVGQQNSKIIFSSEQKAILCNKNFHKALDAEALYEYFTFQNLFTDRTMVKGVKLIPAGHYGTIDLSQKGASLELFRYWDFHFEEPSKVGDRREFIKELDRLFFSAVKRQLVSDVEVGCYLSGGMDSGSIAAIASSSIQNLRTFTCGFDLESASGIEMQFDERPKARLVAERFKTQHYEIMLKSGDMERTLPDLAYHLEEPRVGQSYPNYNIAKLASQHVKVVLSGTGGDELFGGYPWRYFSATEGKSFEGYVKNYYEYWQRLTNRHERKKMFRPIKHEISYVEPFEIFKNVFQTREKKLTRPEDYINLSLYFEAKTFLHGLFIVEDKLSMANSLESRVPFMDNDLVNFAMNCPVEFKLKLMHGIKPLDENETGNKFEKYFQETSNGKQILRDMISHYIPEDITCARKQGFSGPDASWFKGESISFVRKSLLNKTAPIYDYLDFEATTKLIEEHLVGSANRRLLLWSLLNMNEWIGQTF